MLYSGTLYRRSIRDSPGLHYSSHGSQVMSSSSVPNPASLPTPKNTLVRYYTVSLVSTRLCERTGSRCTVRSCVKYVCSPCILLELSLCLVKCVVLCFFRPCNLLKLTGPFSLGEVHAWIGNILPNVPEQPANVSDSPSSSDGGTNTLHFKSTFIATELEVVYKRGEAVFRSDNISTISVLKEVLSKETSSKKVLVKITHGETMNTCASLSPKCISIHTHVTSHTCSRTHTHTCAQNLMMIQYRMCWELYTLDWSLSSC